MVREIIPKGSGWPLPTDPFPRLDKSILQSLSNPHGERYGGHWVDECLQDLMLKQEPSKTLTTNTKKSNKKASLSPAVV